MRRTGLVTLSGAAVLLLAAAGRAQQAPKPADKKPEAKPAPQVLTVTVKALEGTAHRLGGGEKPTWVPLKVGEKLDEQTVVRTGFRTRVVLQFADNSSVTIRRATKMGIAQFRREGRVTKTRLGLKYGSVRATVEKARGPNDFTVATPVATLAVTGTGLETGFCGDTGGKSTCNSGSFTVFKGYQVRALGGGETTNNQMAMPNLILQARLAANIAPPSITQNEKLSMMTRGNGRAGIGFVGGGLGIRKVLPPPRQTVFTGLIDLHGLDIGIGN